MIGDAHVPPTADYPRLALHSPIQVPFPPRSPVAHAAQATDVPRAYHNLCHELGFPGNGLGAARPFFVRGFAKIFLALPQFRIAAPSWERSQQIGLNHLFHANYTTQVMLSKKVKLALCRAGLPTLLFQHRP